MVAVERWHICRAAELFLLRMQLVHGGNSDDGEMHAGDSRPESSVTLAVHGKRARAAAVLVILDSLLRVDLGMLSRSKRLKELRGKSDPCETHSESNSCPLLPYSHEVTDSIVVITYSLGYRR